jgi:hypothetical protein
MPVLPSSFPHRVCGRRLWPNLPQGRAHRAPPPLPAAYGCAAANCGQIRLESKCTRRRTTPPPAAALPPPVARGCVTAACGRICLGGEGTGGHRHLLRLPASCSPLPPLSLWASGGPDPLAMACFSDYEKGPDKPCLGHWPGTKHSLALPGGPASCHAWSGARGSCLAWPRARPDQAARMGIYTDGYPMLSRYMIATGHNFNNVNPMLPLVLISHITFQ